MIIAGYQWVHFQLRKRIVQQLDRVRAHVSREDYVAQLVEDAALAAKRAATNDGDPRDKGAA